MTTQYSNQLLDLLLDDGSAAVRTARKHVEHQSLDDIVFDPSENYRWGSAKAMREDIQNKKKTNDDGTAVSSYDTLKDSIRQIGVQEPVGLVVRDDGLHVVYGFTRVLICQELGLRDIPAYIYDAELSESDVELLQTRENSRNLRREVNWVAEAEMYSSLWGALFLRSCEVNNVPPSAPSTDNTTKTPQAALVLRRKAKEAVCRTLGQHPSRMRSAEHFLRILDPRVIDLARKGHLAYSAAIEFHSGDVDHPFKTEKITAMLKLLKGSTGYPAIISPSKVRQAKRAYDLNFERSLAAVADVDVGEEPEEGPEVRAASSSPLSRETRKSPEKIKSIMHGAERMHTSSAQLRDLADLVAWEALIQYKVDLNSPEAKVREIMGSPYWYKILGISWGTDAVSMPPLAEVILGGRDESDADVARMRLQHDISSTRFVLTAFVRAFLRQAMAAKGVRNLDYDEKGWISGRSSKTNGDVVRHRDLFTNAIQSAMEPEEMPLVERARHAWAQIRPFVKVPR